jgi:predicted negative regulator of RcsB-dependent stress response
MQEFLVILSILAAVGYLGWFIYKHYFSKQSKCDGCAVHKLYEARVDAIGKKMK